MRTKIFALELRQRPIVGKRPSTIVGCFRIWNPRSRTARPHCPFAWTMGGEKASLLRLLYLLKLYTEMAGIWSSQLFAQCYYHCKFFHSAHRPSAGSRTRTCFVLTCVFLCVQMLPSSKINQLPAELLSYIFELGTHLVYDDTDEEEDFHISPCMLFSTPVRDCILSVCSRWRQVALSTPQLWSKPCITIDDTKRAEDRREMPEGGELAFEAISRDLVRSRCYPLDILIDARDPDWNFSEFE